MRAGAYHSLQSTNGSIVSGKVARQKTTTEKATQYQQHQSSTQDILVNKFGMWHVSARWVPGILIQARWGIG